MGAQMALNLISPGHIHYARLENSKRLRRFLQFCMDGEWHSTLEQIIGGRVTSSSTARAELNKNGYYFNEMVEKGENDILIYSYKLTPESLIKANEFFKNITAH